MPTRMIDDFGRMWCMGTAQASRDGEVLTARLELARCPFEKPRAGDFVEDEHGHPWEVILARPDGVVCLRVGGATGVPSNVYTRTAAEWLALRADGWSRHGGSRP